MAYISSMAMDKLGLHDSDAVYAAWYDRLHCILRVTFKAKDGSEGDTYDYLEVPAELVEEFVAAESHGEFVNRFIKPDFDCEKVIWA